MLITIGAMIGAGKTSLAELVAKHFNSEVFYESVDDNPILPLFYTASDEEIQTKRYPFLLQLWFLNTRFKSIKQALVEDNNVLDRSIYEDWYFAKVNKDLGRISDLEFSLYESLLNNMMEELEGMPKKAPDLMIYLSGSFETIIDRIKKRGREYELDEGLVSYYYELWKGYDQWIEQHYQASEVLVINIDEVDYVNNENDKKKVLKMIEDKLNEIRQSSSNA
ncbi:MAG: deoxynucleoside kinase [Turicibacter sp.]|jgi:deoxyadenosine/deoxycytidine kinase|uniref:Deoxyadenosine kinase n=1 Tax=Turicibacter faecis TaxID=2963365 RepID=A0ABM8IKB9_9FIRM|nr:deoxynucleoside kinase [Turicibacter sp.]NCE77708.1 deoxynucleoside kinase [Turicibacter sp. TS3]BEH90070.1 deoxyadenosine kinase [Turicibacter sp. TC023]